METNFAASRDNSSREQTPKQPIYKPTVEAYNQWAATYDTDGNFLQKLDSLMMDEIMPFLTNIIPHAPKLVELGCGTGRNTVRLQSVPGARIWAIDNSNGMIELAKDRCHLIRATVPEALKAQSQEFALRDVLSFQVNERSWDPMKNADAIISTLVLEHIPLEQFFMVCSQLLRPGGQLLCTNMHSDMGAMSQAGFVDPATGNKIRPLSYAHTLQDFMMCASAWGFNPLWGPLERMVETSDLEQLGERGKKWVGVNAWFGVILSKLG
ncbi:MAG: hypothetical protein Q9205_001591 [Flavoplaca limonia]